MYEGRERWGCHAIHSESMDLDWVFAPSLHFITSLFWQSCPTLFLSLSQLFESICNEGRVRVSRKLVETVTGRREILMIIIDIYRYLQCRELLWAEAGCGCTWYEQLFAQFDWFGCASSGLNVGFRLTRPSCYRFYFEIAGATQSLWWSRGPLVTTLKPIFMNLHRKFEAIGDFFSQTYWSCTKKTCLGPIKNGEAGKNWCQAANLVTGKPCWSSIHRCQVKSKVNVGPPLRSEVQCAEELYINI